MLSCNDCQQVSSCGKEASLGPAFDDSKRVPFPVGVLPDTNHGCGTWAHRRRPLSFTNGSYVENISPAAWSKNVSALVATPPTADLIVERRTTLPRAPRYREEWDTSSEG